MKRVRIDAYNVGLVFKKNNYNRILQPGVYWLGLSESISIFSMAKQFIAPCNLNILLNDKEFMDATIFIEIRDNEIALQYENELFAGVLTPGRYVFWKGLVNYKFNIIDLNNIEIDKNIEKSILSRKEVIPYIRVVNVDSYEKCVMFIDGKYEKTLEPGAYLFWKNMTTINVAKVDMRAIQMEISGQEILTKDKAALRINFFVQYKVVDVTKALVNNKEFEKQLYVLNQLALREFIGGYTLDELLEKKENISQYVVGSLNEKAKGLGVSIIGSGIRDIILPGDVKDIMNQVLVAEKKAQANIIMRREETASTRSLLNTAKLMEENSMLFKLKEMEYVEKIAEKINNISLSGNSLLVDQLKQIFVPVKKQ